MSIASDTPVAVEERVRPYTYLLPQPNLELLPVIKNLRRLASRADSFLKGLALVLASGVAYIAAYELRFDLAPGPAEVRRLWTTLPILLLVRGVMNWWWGLHRQLWRFTSLPDLRRIVVATFAGSAAFALVLAWSLLWDVPRSVLLLEPVLSFLLASGLMVGSRWRHAGQPRMRPSSGKRVLIVGAGETGNSVARELLRDPAGKLVPVAFADDDAKKRGAIVHGIPVLGKVADIPEVVGRHQIDEIVIAMPSAGRKRMREVVDTCKATGVRFRIMPGTVDLIEGRVTVNQLREVRIEDLLGRPPVAFDLDSVRPLLRDSVILVTGASGSIGSELCRQVAACGPQRLVMVDRNENNLHFLHLDLEDRFPAVAFEPVVADITDTLRIEQVMAASRPRVVFQGAAYKHVPLMEANPCEAVKNNVIGTSIVAQMASYYGAERFVMISTDKAINPTSIMGSSKRIAEVLLQRLQRVSRTRFITVRFGNVLGSDGSVVPLFTRQIARGGPVTVTHPEVLRYFMLVEEAVHLVLQASVLGSGAEIFLLDMGEPVRIADLAADMIRLSGLEPNVDIEVRFTGLRPGEKLYEELITASEVVVGTRHPRILRLNEQNHIDANALDQRIAELEGFALAGQSEAVRRMIREIVPEYQGQAADGWPAELDADLRVVAKGAASRPLGPWRVVPERERKVRPLATARGKRA